MRLLRPFRFICFCILFVPTLVFAQNPVCPSSYFYSINTGSIKIFNTSLPQSSTNPSTVPVPLPTGGNGQPLALLPNINGGTLSPTFYATNALGGPYLHWDGSSWVNTLHASATGTANNVLFRRGLAGCSGRLYELIVPTNSLNSSAVYVYNGLGPASLLLTLSNGIFMEDLVTDCNCNFYILDNASPQQLTMYNPQGIAVCSYSLTTPLTYTSGGGMAMIGNTVYVFPGGNDALYSGVLGGASITFTPDLTPGFTYFNGAWDFASCASCNTSSITVSVNGGTVNCYTPTPTIGVNLTTVLSPVSYSWVGPGITGSSTTAVTSVSTAGMYTCTINAGGCPPLQPPTQTIVTVAVASNTLPTLASISPTGNVCPYPSWQLFSSPNSSLYTSSWQGPGIVSGVNSPTLNMNSAGLYTVVVTNTLNGCSDTQTVNVLSPPSLTLSASANTLCAQNYNGSSTTITLTATGALNYTLLTLPNFTTATPNASVFSVNPIAPFSNTLTSGSLTLVGFDGTCSNGISASYSIVPNPVIGLSPLTSSICFGETISLTANGATSYSWSPATGLNTTNGATVVANPTLNTIYSVVGSSVGCNSVTQNLTLTVLPLPLISILPNPAGVCLNTSTVNLTASGSGTSFTWSPATGLSQTTGQTVQAYPLTAQNYTVLASLNGCTNTAVATVTVVPPPSLTVSLSSPSLCAQALNGSPNSITLTSSGAASYTLQTPYHITSSNPQGPLVPISSVPPYNTGIATATLYGANAFCTVSTSVNFSVVPNPTVTVVSATPVICAGQSFTYTSNGASSYTWGPNSPGITTYSNGQVAVVNPSINSVFSVVGGSLGCYSALHTTTLSVFPLPVIQINPGQPTLCLNGSVELTAGGTGTSFSWSPSSSLNQMNGATVLASPLTQQNYTLIASANNCTNSAVFTVSVLPLPSPIITKIKAEVCLFDDVILQGSGGLRYDWDVVGGFHAQTNPLQVKAKTMSMAGNYTLTVTDEQGCRASAEVDVLIHNLPTGNLVGSKTKECVPFCSDFNFSDFSTAAKITNRWELDGKAISTNEKFSACFSEAKEYKLVGYLQDTETTCINTQTFYVQGLPKPVANFIYSPLKPIEGLDNVQFTNTSEGERLSAFNWYFISNSGFTSKQKNVEYNFSEAGKYPIVLVASNEWNCKDTLIKTIEVAFDFTFYVPNVFTPNFDDLNDVFLPVIRGIRLYDMQIFDRWGALVFSSNEAAKGWDGSFKGEPCKQDVYVWKITVSTISGEQKNQTGQVLLSR